jgi:16S rRNA (cytosine967-C5)-methyltransferase
VSRYLKTGGRLFYITCSVFKKENEDVVDEITKETGLKLIRSSLINGISIQADSMFIAEFENVKVNG